MNTKNLLFVSLIIILVFSAGTVYIYNYLHKPEIIEIAMDLVVEDTKIIGVNPDTDALHFGTIPRKGSSTRKFNIANNKDYPLFINISLEGDFVQWINISKNNFILEPKESELIKFTVKVPGNAISKIYNGTAYVSLRRY